MAVSKKQREHQNRYDAEHFKQYSIKFPKDIYEAVERAMASSGMNRNKWTTTAIIEKLERDGFYNVNDKM